eukprot:2153406-Rhodomonas_salina.1
MTAPSLRLSDHIRPSRARDQAEREPRRTRPTAPALLRHKTTPHRSSEGRLTSPRVRSPRCAPNANVSNNKTSFGTRSAEDVLLVGFCRWPEKTSG